ncbi:hypothetical protein C6497_13065 [Candidatus Poribacteria bacterium]|nr:MAG: hypothetical protein C6497_13065 [Candidatus Poribacteria bacterium]
MKSILEYLHNNFMSIKIIQTQFFISTLWALSCLMFLNWNANAEDITSDADRFLKQLQGAEYRGMGGSFVGVTGGANAIGNNPAGIDSETGDRFIINMTRFPHTVVLLSKANETKKYEDYSRYEQNASGIETLNWAFPMGKLGTIGFAFSLAHEGSFRRVNHQGKAINSFPENNLALGFSYGLNCFKGTTVGLDTKWIRSKVRDTFGSEHLGRGYAYNIGMIQQFGKGFHVGLVVRNLSNGLSFIDPNIPDKILRDVIAGVTYQYDISNIAVRLGLDLHPLFTDGIRANIGTEVWYHNRFGVRIGYLRDTEKRYASVYLLEDATFEMDERTWKAEGVSFGIGVRTGNITINGAYTPEYKPTKSDDERLHVVQGTAVYTFSIEQAF